ncbi:MAG: DUF4430 domain-containing protein [Clostridia bacterium]|nr:DUF4430 domain-containing protein [Clostridia bacterium]
MKKIVSLNLIFVLIFMLCSCGLTVTQTDNTATKKASEILSETETQTEKKSEENTTEITEKKTEESTTEIKTEATTQKTTQKVTEKTTAKPVKMITCMLGISCENILKNKDNLKENKEAFLPKNGAILNSVKVTVPEGSTAFDVIKKACADNVCTDGCAYCKKNGIQLDYVYTPGYENYYIRGIHQIYEKDCGTQSGWMYCVNGAFPNYGCSQYKVKDGDSIRFLYTCDLGEDLGAGQ